MSALKSLAVAVAVLAATLAPLPGLDRPDARWCLVIFAAAAALWITELIPAFATALITIVLCAYILGHPAIAPDHSPSAWQAYLNPLASPVLVLFFGGFVLAQAATRHGFDIRMAQWLIAPCRNRPALLLLSVILCTAVFSMFMSNTATCAMMIAILMPVLRQDSVDDGLRRRMVLAVPFAANIGGMGTVIGTPPNAVAASVLAQLGHPVSFFGWMATALPIVALLLVLLWALLLRLFPTRVRSVDLQTAATAGGSAALRVVVLVFTVTILGWLTEPLHGLPAALVAMLPVAIFFGSGILTREDLRLLDWDVLLLVAGGLTLGTAMAQTGLSAVLVSAIPAGALPTVALLGLVALATVLLSNFMSNTSAANMLIPIVAALGSLSPRVGALAVALCASLAMSLPISTPPNAIAFATRFVSTRDLLRYGTLVSLIGVPLVLAWILLLRSWLD